MSRAFSIRLALALASGISVFLSFEKFNLVPLIFAFPLFYVALVLRCSGFRSGFGWGWVTSSVIGWGTAYWVVHVLHEFSGMPSWVAFVIFIFASAFVALSFAVFAGCAAWLQSRMRWNTKGPWTKSLWFAVALPALFTVVDFLVPQIFPCSIGHALYAVPWVNQIVEITGVPFLTFAIFATGSALFAPKRLFLMVPIALWAVALGFSKGRLSAPLPVTKPLEIAIIQPGISHFTKVQARGGREDQVRAIVDTLEQMTEAALFDSLGVQLIVWPETALPFRMDVEGKFQNQIRAAVTRWNVPLITGAYAAGSDGTSVYNSAVLLQPAGGGIRSDVYRKNILLAFGEYFPLIGKTDFFLSLFPSSVQLGAGKEQDPLVLASGTRVGTTICYEDVFAQFGRKVARQKAHFLLNLTNDSWYGDTSEPWLHASLATFRALEARVPLVRVTNTGLSFWIDSLGKRHALSQLGAKQVQIVSIPIGSTSGDTYFVLKGDWFVVVCGLVFVFCLGVLVFQSSRRHSLVWGHT